MAAPTFVTSSAATVVAGAIATASISWTSGDIVVVLGMTEDNSVVYSTPTTAGSGLTFSAISGSPTNTASRCKGYAWSATASASGSGTIQATASGGASLRGMIVAFVFSGSTGIGGTAFSASLGATTTQSLTRTGANSHVVQIWGDWNAVNDTAVTWNNSGTQVDVQFTSGAFTEFSGRWGDQGSSGTTSYGFTAHAGGGDFTAITLEILGTASASLPDGKRMFAEAIARRRLVQAHVDQRMLALGTAAAPTQPSGQSFFTMPLGWVNPLRGGGLDITIGTRPSEDAVSPFGWAGDQLTLRPKRGDGFASARPSYFSEPAVVNPFSQTDWPLARGKRPLLQDYQSWIAVDDTAPVQAPSWDLPAVGKHRDGTWTVDAIRPTAVVAVPFSQADWPNALRERLPDVAFVVEGLLTGGAVPFSETDWPLFLAWKRGQWFIGQNLVETTLAPVVVPVASGDWPNPRSRGRMLGTWVSVGDILKGRDTMYGGPGQPLSWREFTNPLIKGRAVDLRFWAQSLNFTTLTPPIVPGLVRKFIHWRPGSRSIRKD